MDGATWDTFHTQNLVLSVCHGFMQDLRVDGIVERWELRITTAAIQVTEVLNCPIA